MAGYTREFLISAAISKYAGVLGDKFDEYLQMLERNYDSWGRDKFRVQTGLDAAAIRKYKASV